MKKRITTGWTFPRVLFLMAGMAMLIQSLLQKQWAGVALGGYFASMGIFSFGCAAGCYGGNCTAETQIMKTKDTPEKPYES